MNFIKTALPDVVIIQPSVFKDARGYFFESFNKKQVEQHIANTSFVQDNESKSDRGVLRGLHFQKPPFEQAKLVRCIQGTVLDVAVDLRTTSPTYGQHITVELSGENKKQLYIPRGFAHGFIVLSSEAIFAYKVDNYYAPKHDAGICYDDPILSINWHLQPDDIIVSEKDKYLPYLNDIQSPF